MFCVLWLYNLVKFSKTGKNQTYKIEMEIKFETCFLPYKYVCTYYSNNFKHICDSNSKQ